MAEEFKLHEKSKLRLDHVATKVARHQKHSQSIPMYFEYFHNAVGYFLPESHQPTADAAIYAVAKYFGFCRNQLSIDKNEYGDLRINLLNKPFAHIWWELDNA